MIRGFGVYSTSVFKKLVTFPVLLSLKYVTKFLPTLLFYIYDSY